MATIGVLIARIEARMSLAAGIDVQVIEEPKLLELLRHKYNTMFDANWWADYMVLEEFTTDGTTGVITGTVENKIRRFQDIHSVYYERQPHPLPIITFGNNPLLRSRPCIMPYTSDAEKMFKIMPIDVAATIQVWYRTRMSDEEWEEGDDDVAVNMDDELLITGVVADYLHDDGSNPEAAQRYMQQHLERKKQLEQLAFQQPIEKHGADRGYSTQWDEAP